MCQLPTFEAVAVKGLKRSKFTFLPFWWHLRSIGCSTLKGYGMDRPFPACQGDELSIFIGVLEPR
jgi:hypothetical protein